MNEVVKKFPKKKIVLGLVIVGMLMIFVGCVCSTDEPANANKTVAAAPAPPPKPVATPAAQAKPADEFGPDLACQFVKWWASKSMDYSPSTAQAAHAEAFRWMTPETVQAFQTCFWTPGIEQAITSGQVAAAFQPVSVQAEAINPDGSIVVALNGTLVMQAGGGTAPVTQQIAADFLVKKEPNCLRICNLYNRTTVAPGN